MKQLCSFSIYKRILLGAGSGTRPVLPCLMGNEPQTQAYVSKGVYCGCRASVQGALRTQGGITKHWSTEWPFFQACLPGEWLPSSWSLAESPRVSYLWPFTSSLECVLLSQRLRRSSGYSHHNECSVGSLGGPVSQSSRKIYNCQKSEWSSIK